MRPKYYYLKGMYKTLFSTIEKKSIYEEQINKTKVSWTLMHVIIIIITTKIYIYIYVFAT